MKVYVAVIVRFSPEGRLKPLSLEWEDGRVFIIDRITDISRAPAVKAGGTGWRYTIYIEGRQTYLFFDEGRWFVERRE